MKYIPEINDNIPISIRLSSDLPEAHHNLEHSPYAQGLPLGWIVVGETSLNKSLSTKEQCYRF